MVYYNILGKFIIRGVRGFIIRGRGIVPSSLVSQDCMLHFGGLWGFRRGWGLRFVKFIVASVSVPRRAIQVFVGMREDAIAFAPHHDH